MGGLARGEIDEGTFLGVERLERREDLRPHVGCETGPHLAREPQLLALVVADEQRIYSLCPAVPANRVLLRDPSSFSRNELGDG